MLAVRNAGAQAAGGLTRDGPVRPADERAGRARAAGRRGGGGPRGRRCARSFRPACLRAIRPRVFGAAFRA